LSSHSWSIIILHWHTHLDDDRPKLAQRQSGSPRYNRKNREQGKVAAPAITAKTVSAWEQQKPQLRRAFEEQVYGIMPKSFETPLLSYRPILKHGFQARIEEVQLKTSRGENYTAVLVMPEDASTSRPVIMMENFCPNLSEIRPSLFKDNCLRTFTLR